MPKLEKTESMKCLWCNDRFAQLIALYISKLMHAIEESYLNSSTWSAARHSHRSTSTSCSHCRCLGSSTQYEENTQQTRTIRNTFIKLTESKIDGYSEGRVICDRYLDQSLKVKTRQKRAPTSTEFAVCQEMKLYQLKNFFPHQKPSTIWHACLLKVY